MAVNLYWRYAAAVTLAAYRALRTTESSEPGGWARVTRELWDDFHDPESDDADLSARWSAETGTVADVATFEGAFELRRVQVQWTQASGGIEAEDVRVCTFHLIKLVAGAPSDTWLAADFTAASNAITTWWTAMAPEYADTTTLDFIKYYREGPSITPPQPPVNQLDLATPGGSTGASQLPPQVAVSVMERHSGVRKNHGRFYLPSPSALVLSDEGRLAGTYCTQWANDIQTMYAAWKTNNTPAVVYLPALPERSPDATDPRYVTKGTFPPRVASARTVDEIVVDNVFDVIRSRRFAASTNRQARAI